MTQASFHPVGNVDQKASMVIIMIMMIMAIIIMIIMPEQGPGPSLGLGPPSSPREPPSQWCLKICSICKNYCGNDVDDEDDDDDDDDSTER